MDRITFTWIDAKGHDIDGTDAVQGYHVTDFFSNNLEEIEREAADTYEMNAWLESAYRGPDIDGIGLRWTIA